MTQRRFLTADSVLSAKQIPFKPVFIKQRKQKGAKAIGLRYEKKALEKIERLAKSSPLDVQLHLSPWFEYTDKDGKHWCQPDCVAMTDDRLLGIVVEVKYKHTADAWFQLWKLYVPVLKVAFPDVKVWGTIEMVKWLDPAVVFPERFDLTDSPLKVISANRTSVHIWNPSRDYDF